MSNRNELVYYRNPALEGVGQTTRARLERESDWYECDADGNRLKKRRAAEPTRDAGQKADDDKPTAAPAGTSEGR